MINIMDIHWLAAVIRTFVHSLINRNTLIIDILSMFVLLNSTIRSEQSSTGHKIRIWLAKIAEILMLSCGHTLLDLL